MTGYWNAMFIIFAPPTIILCWLAIFSEWVQLP